MKQTFIVNLFGGPGSGKSTLAAKLFSILKQKGISCDIPYEFPKIVAWEKNYSQISDQLYILANQHRGIVRSFGKVDFIILDSPILLSLIYKDAYTNDYPVNFYGTKFDDMIVDLFKKYDNINFYLNRDNQNFEAVGRLQDKTQSIYYDEKIKQSLVENEIPFYEIGIGDEQVDSIISILMLNRYGK
jgi:nicotinamide riboside kinase